MTRSRRGFGALEIIVIIAIIGLLATLGWIFLTRDNTKTAQENQTDSTKESPELRPENVTEKIRAFYDEKYTLLDIDKNNQPTEKQMSIRIQESSPPYKVDGYDYYVTYNGGSTIDIMRPWTVDEQLPTEKDIEVRKEIEKIYHEVGLDSVESISDGSGNLTNYFEGNGLVCSIEATSAAVSGSSASCGSLKEYPKTAESMKPFANILEYTEGTTILSGSAKQSKTPDYQIATISVGNIQGGGATALLWKRGVGNWTLFRYVQNTPSCSIFNTNGLRSAFEGEPCFDETTQKDSTVTRSTTGS